MPELDGFSTCAAIKKTKDIPVIMLSARGEEYDRIHGFECGVDDYVVKPFSPKELMMRAKVVMSRQKTTEKKWISIPMRDWKFVSAMLTPVDATVSTLKVQLALLTVLLIGISLLLTWLASRAISKSLIRLNLSAKAMAEGDYTVSFDEDDYGEIAQLSDTLNYAVTELAKTDDLRKELIAADKITQVLCNLIGNAINYTGADKKIIVRQSLHEHHVRVDVIDSGEGIAAQDIPYVWDRYYKGDKARKRLVSGTGLGLSIVQKILELHGATYGVESKPGMGADFWFAFEIVEK